MKRVKLIRYFRHYRSGRANDLPNLQDDQIVRYLLGDLRGKQTVSLEQQYFANDDRFEYLRAMEDELIDRYLRGELSARDSGLFQIHFLTSPLRRERVESARALIAAVAPSAMVFRRNTYQQTRWTPLAWCFACAMLLLAIGLSWAIWENVGLQNQLAIAKLALEHHEHDIRGGAVVPSAPLTMSFVLAPVQRGLGNGNRLIVPPDAQSLDLSVDLPPSAQPPYRAIFRTPDGDQVGTSSDIVERASPAGMVAVIKIPAAVFYSETYILTLQGSRPRLGFRDLRSYAFTVARR